MNAVLRSAETQVPAEHRRGVARVRCDADIALLTDALEAFGFVVVTWSDLDERPPGPGEWRIEIVYVEADAAPPSSSTGPRSGIVPSSASDDAAPKSP